MLKGLSGITTHETEARIEIFPNTQDIASLSKVIEQRMADRSNPLRYGFLMAGHGLYTGATRLPTRAAKWRCWSFCSKLSRRNACSLAHSEPHCLPMASIRIPAGRPRPPGREQDRSFLLPFGIHYDRWAIEGRIDRDATAEEILTAYEPEVTALKQQGGYLTADVVDVKPETPNLDMLPGQIQQGTPPCRGRGALHRQGSWPLLHPPGKRRPAVLYRDRRGRLYQRSRRHQALVRPCAGPHHPRAIRLFKDMSGWTPALHGDEIASGYQPLCFGPNPLAGKGIRIDQPVLIA